MTEGVCEEGDREGIMERISTTNLEISSSFESDREAEALRGQQSLTSSEIESVAAAEVNCEILPASCVTRWVLRA